MSIETRTHTALHVLKGAVMKVLDAKWTAGVSVNGKHGRLTVQYDKKPTEEEISRIERETNYKIEENVTIEIHEIERSDAERRWGELIYDLFPIPPSITKLSIFHLPEWNVNACNKQHTMRTGEIGVLKITKIRYRASKKLLEISFDIE